MYEIAIGLVASRGYEGTTLRDIAREAGVSPTLLYRYFPSKRAVVLELHDDLSLLYAEHATAMPEGTWGARFLFALRSSLAVLTTHRPALLALGGVLVGGGTEGLFAAGTAFSRARVQGVFEDAVRGAADVPAAHTAAALGRLLYIAHLAVVLFWLLDKSAGQRATSRLLDALQAGLPWAALVVASGAADDAIRIADAMCAEALLAEDAPQARRA
ncbi:MAG: TetR family transcriptional regulator [Polyangiaceae bacterium]